MSFVEVKGLGKTYGRTHAVDDQQLMREGLRTLLELEQGIDVGGEPAVLALVAQGLSNKETADRLFLAEGTVKNYVSAILLKIDARDRTQAAVKAREMGILPK